MTNGPSRQYAQILSLITVSSLRTQFSQFSIQYVSSCPTNRHQSNNDPIDMIETNTNKKKRNKLNTAPSPLCQIVCEKCSNVRFEWQICIYNIRKSQLYPLVICWPFPRLIQFHCKLVKRSVGHTIAPRTTQDNQTIPFTIEYLSGSVITADGHAMSPIEMNIHGYCICSI